MTAVEVPTDLPTESAESRREEAPVNGHTTPDEDLPRERKDSELDSKQSENGKSTTTDDGPPPEFSEERRDSKIANARNKFESQNSFSKKSGHKRKEKVKYAGLASAKNKFMDAATADRRQSLEKKKPIRITPPRDGNFAGVVESEPAPPDPNVIRSGSLPDEDVLTGATSASARARFKEIEKGERKASAGGDSKVELDPEVTKNLRSVWKTRETNPEPGSASKERKAPVKIREEGDGGVYENNPEVLTDVVRATDQPDEVMPEGVDTRALRDRFLRGSVDENKEKKLSALPIKMAEGEGGVYENQPVELEGVVRAGEYRAVNVEEEVGRWASEARLRFMEDACRVSESIRKEKPPVQLELAEGGVFENEPSQRREDVVYSEEADDLQMPENTVKNSLQRLKEIKEAASRVHTSKTPVIVEKNDTSAGVYENVPESSRADASAADMLALQSAGAETEAGYASQAKQRFLERQRSEEAGKRKEAPEMVNIWADLCRDSGVFENKPAERDPNIVREVTPESDEDDEDEEEDEEEEEEEEEEETKAVNGTAEDSKKDPKA